MKKPIIVVIGGSYGSESKGLVAARLTLDKEADYCVRTGSINAGHTVYFRGKKYVNQLLPVGWIRKEATLVLGAGCYIEPDLLESEINMINEAWGDGSDVRDRLIIDHRCGLHLDKHMSTEQGMRLHQSMGSTGHGVMAAIVDKMHRDRDYHLFGYHEKAGRYKLRDTALVLNNAYDRGERILLEGTQGTLLDFHFGYYPFVTTRQTTAAAWMTEAGLSPNLQVEIYMTMRTMPIRVAGNSGPMGEEVSWGWLLRRINDQLAVAGKPGVVSEAAIDAYEKAEAEVVREGDYDDLPMNWDQQVRWQNANWLSEFPGKVLAKISPEYLEELRKVVEITTVTKKIRRIARLDPKDLKQAVMLNRPDSIVVNFLNYLFPSCWGATTENELDACYESTEIRAYLQELADKAQTPIEYVNAAPDCLIRLTYPIQPVKPKYQPED